MMRHGAAACQLTLVLLLPDMYGQAALVRQHGAAATLLLLLLLLWLPLLLQQLMPVMVPMKLPRHGTLRVQCCCRCCRRACRSQSACWAKTAAGWLEVCNLQAVAATGLTQCYRGLQHQHGHCLMNGCAAVY
jgi:hypothetical protein